MFKSKAMVVLSVFTFFVFVSVNVQAKKPNFTKAKRDTIKYIKKHKKYKVKTIKKDGRMLLGRTSDVQREYGKYAPKNKMAFPFKVVTYKKGGVAMSYTGNAVYMRPIMSKRNNWKFSYFDIMDKKMIGGTKFSVEKLRALVITAMDSKERKSSWFKSDAKYIHSISNLKIIMDKFRQEDSNRMEFWVQFTVLKRNVEQTVVKKARYRKKGDTWVFDSPPLPVYDVKYRNSSSKYYKNLKRDDLKKMPNLAKDNFSEVENFKY